jgi:ComF family protein
VQRCAVADSLFQTITGAFTALIAPNSCASCRASVKKAEAGKLCGICTSAVARLPASICACCGLPIDELSYRGPDSVCPDCTGGRGFDRARAFGLFDGLLRDLIRRLKYQGDKQLAEPLGQLLLEVGNAEFLLGDYDAIVPVPLHRERFTERGFNQTFLLARPIAREARLPVVTALERRVSATAQVGLQGAARRANVKDAFSVHPRKASEVTRRRILLIDDVITTGATADECARALKKAGAKEVDVLAVARTP